MSQQHRLNISQAVQPGLVSIIVCSYNNWPDIEMAIWSALQQSYRPIEVIVVDNGSADRTVDEIPRRFAGRINFIQQQNLLDAGAYNTGWRLSSGEYLQFLDGDDVLSPNKIEKQVEAFRVHPEADIVFGGIRQFQTAVGVAAWTDAETRQEDDMLAALILSEGDNAGISALGTLFRRTALERIGPWDHNLYTSDSDYWLRSAWGGCKFRYCDISPTGFSRRRAGQMSADSEAMMLGMEAVLEKALTYITTDLYRNEIVRKLARLYFYTAISSDRLTREQALEKLRRARSICPQAVSGMAYLTGKLLLNLPGGRHLVQAKWLGFVRRTFAVLIGHRVSA